MEEELTEETDNRTQRGDAKREEEVRWQNIARRKWRGRREKDAEMTARAEV